jgi:hypothetical protein
MLTTAGDASYANFEKFGNSFDPNTAKKDTRIDTKNNLYFVIFN